MNFIAGVAMALALTVTAQAQNARSFVATTGNDANTCGSASYCRTFARALAVTNSGGEIVVVNSGGYGPFTVSHPVVISAIGIDASVTQTTAGQNAITINTTGNVSISGLNLSGGAAGNDGILVQTVGFLHLYSMQIQNFANHGIEVSSATGLSIYDSKVTDNGVNGLLTNSSTFVQNTAFDNNGSAGALSNAGYLAIAGSSAQHNSIGFQAVGGTISLDGDSVSLNGTGLMMQSGGKVYVAHSVVSGNTTAYNIAVGCTLAGSNPGTTLIAPGQSTSGTPATATNLM